MILLRRRYHQMRQDRQRHILECDCRTVKKIQIISMIRLCKRRDLFRIEFGIVSPADTVLQLLIGKVRQIEFHNLIGDLLIAHIRHIF